MYIGAHVYLLFVSVLLKKLKEKKNRLKCIKNKIVKAHVSLFIKYKIIKIDMVNYLM